MNDMFKATPDDVAAVAEALEFAALLDDRVAKPDKARVAAWAEQIHPHRLGRNDILNAVQTYYETGVARPVGIGDIIEIARAARRDRLARESDEELDRRYDEQGVKALGETLSGFVGGPVKYKTPRFLAAQEALQTCYGKEESMAAIKEFFAAKAEAKKGNPA